MIIMGTMDQAGEALMLAGTEVDSLRILRMGKSAKQPLY